MTDTLLSQFVYKIWDRQITPDVRFHQKLRAPGPGQLSTLSRAHALTIVITAPKYRVPGACGKLRSRNENFLFNLNFFRQEL